MNVTLVNPPQTQLWNPLSYPPLGLLYIAAALEQAGIEVAVHNQPHRTLEDQQDEIPAADIYGITCTSPNLPESARLTALLKARNPKSTVVVGGVHPTVDPLGTLNRTGADYVLDGEGERAFVEFVKHGSPGQVITAGRIYDLDSLPFPARHLLPREVIRDESGIHSGEDATKKRRVAAAQASEADSQPATTVITSRGCPFRCSFCAKTRVTEGVRFRSPQNIVAELDHLRDEYGIRHFRLVDDAVTMDRFRVADLMALTGPRGYRFTTILRADSIKGPEMVRQLYDGGVRIASFGVESGSPEMLQRINKRETVDEIKQSIRWCQEAGIKAKVFLIFGLPGETLETIEATKRFMQEAKPDSFTLSSFQPLPGSDIFEQPAKYNIRPLYDWHQGQEFWFYHEPDEDRGFHFELPEPVRKARGDLIKWLRSGDWR